MSDLETYCLERSRWLRCRPNDSRWLVRLAVEQLPAETLADGETDEQLRRRIGAKLEQAVRERCGNPVVIWLLLNVIVPIVVRLVVEWWMNRKEA